MDMQKRAREPWTMEDAIRYAREGIGIYGDDEPEGIVMRAFLRALAAQPAEPVAEKIASHLERKAWDYADEFGSVDPSTNALEFGRGDHARAKEEYYNNLLELAEEIRAKFDAATKQEHVEQAALRDELLALWPDIRQLQDGQASTNMGRGRQAEGGAEPATERGVMAMQVMPVGPHSGMSDRTSRPSTQAQDAAQPDAWAKARRIAFAMSDAKNEEWDKLLHELLDLVGNSATVRATPPSVEDEMLALRTALERCMRCLEKANVTEGYCMCGSAIEAHGFGSGHSPVDAGEYYASQAIEDARAALKGASK